MMLFAKDGKLFRLGYANGALRTFKDVEPASQAKQWTDDLNQAT
jgi:hypothetical protein